MSPKCCVGCSRKYFNAVILLIAVTADRVTKYWALSGSLGSLYLNYGISFSLLEHRRSLGLFFTFAGLGTLGYICVKNPAVRRAPGIILLFAGAAGNLTDRIVYGYVIDWIPIAIFSDLFSGLFSNLSSHLFLNLADLWLCIGCFQFLKHCLAVMR
ncbi:MAG: signal peptidase II [Synergistaceae bacterium]|jgi:signal peptidase II|nr:signal peptidase II [Synergistaceae bacterium]